MGQSGQFQAQPGLESPPSATHVKLLTILKVLPLVTWSFISLTKSNWFHSASFTAKYNLKNLLGLAPARNICASTLGNLPKITVNAGFRFPKGVAFLCPLSLSIPASHWHRGRNIYSSPVLLRRAKIDTWHKCLDVSLRPGPEQQTNLPLEVSKPRSGLLYHYLITHYDSGILTFLICIHAHDLYMLLFSWL